MNILTRYLIRAHAGPFFFALSALTALLFLNAVAQRVQDLAGKGLTWDVLFEFMRLSLPHTIALTLPMAVLVSVLFAFSELTASNEITAMRAGGIRLQRLLLPILGLGAIVGLLMFTFNDRVLPEANHQLKNLIVDINRKSPTFTLREQVVNSIDLLDDGQRVFLHATRIDNKTNGLYHVVILDPTDPVSYRWTVADSGTMHFNANRTDLYLTLFDGVTYETSVDPPGEFNQIYFQKQVAPFRGVGNEMVRELTGGGRSNREMTLDTLMTYAKERDFSADSLRAANRACSSDAVRFAIGRDLGPGSCLQARMDVVTAFQSPTVGLLPERVAAPTDDHVLREISTNARANATHLESLTRTADAYWVEIHKKYSLAVACLVFVLIGAPLAVRFPGGGLGMVVAVSSFVFGVYWVCLIGGESLAEKGLAPPALGMWFPNVVFGLVGLALLQQMGRETSTTMRGNTLDDVLASVRQRFARPSRDPRVATR